MHRIARQKLEWRGYQTVKKNFEDMCNRLGTIPACDRQTDGHLASRTKNEKLHWRDCVTASKTLSVHPMHRYSPVGAIVNNLAE